MTGLPRSSHQSISIRGMPLANMFLLSALKELRLTGAIPASIRLVNNFELRFGQALKPDPSYWKGVLDRIQKLVLGIKRQDGGLDRKTLIPVRFVPMTGKARQREDQ